MDVNAIAIIRDRAEQLEKDIEKARCKMSKATNPDAIIKYAQQIKCVQFAINELYVCIGRCGETK